MSFLAGPGRPRALIVLVTALVLLAGSAEARPGSSGFGMGSRGSRTYSAPMATPTAPRAAAPIERSTVPPGQYSPNPGYRPGAPYGAPYGGFGSRWGGLSGGLLGGFLGAGLFGLLLGHGLFGGFGGFGSGLGFLLQIVLIVLLARWAWSAFQRSRQPLAGGAGPLGRVMSGGGLGGLGGGGAPTGRVRDELGITKPDYDAFDRVLVQVETAYGREDIAALRPVTTPEMLSYLAEELSQNASRGVVNRVEEPRLLQGDLAEAWREGNTEYATVAMRFSVKDYTVDRASGRVVEGDPSRPTEATEVWTFVRVRGGRWLLSALQRT
jgi:predicted lipid-binding transport protein (Tim44 family)